MGRQQGIAVVPSSARFGVVLSRIISGCLRTPLFLLLAVQPSLSAAENIASRPVGFIRVELPSSSAVLVSSPFNALGTNGVVLWTAAAGIIIRWSVAEQSYVLVQEDGDRAEGGPMPPLKPGDAFWIQPRASTGCVAFLGGEVVLDASNVVALCPALSMIGYPYSTPMRLADTALWSLWTNAQAAGSSDQLGGPLSEEPSAGDVTLGRGFWYNRDAADSLVWTEPRPYADVFPSDREPPSVTSLRILPGGNGMALIIQCHGVAGETLEVFYQDLFPTNRFNTVSGWRIAEADLPTDGQRVIEWLDTGSGDRLPVSAVAGRCYLVGRADIDLNGNGLPDVEDLFVHPSCELNARATARDVLGQSLARDQASALRETPVPGGRRSDETVYVSSALGDDSFDGFASSTRDGHGPKKTIRAGINAAAAGGTVVVVGGCYDESVLGSDSGGMTLLFTGEVRLK